MSIRKTLLPKLSVAASFNKKKSEQWSADEYLRIEEAVNQAHAQVQDLLKNGNKSKNAFQSRFI